MSPRSKGENKRVRKESQEKILYAALALFATKGYHPTTISQIAQKAGVSKGLMYNYYGSKEELLKAVVLSTYEEAAALISAAVSPQVLDNDLSQIIRITLRIFTKMLKEKSELWKMSISLSMQIADMPEIKEIMTKVFEGVYQEIEAILISKNHKDAFREARLIAATMDGIALHYLVLGEDFKLEEVKDKFVELCCQYQK